jgi:hypothetical protein
MTTAVALAADGFKSVPPFAFYLKFALEIFAVRRK